MRYKIWTNESSDPTREYMPFSDGYRPEAVMQLAYKGELHEDFSTHGAALEQIFYIFNMQHPADYKAHSLSVGDVVVLIDPGNEERDAYACEPCGWKRLTSFNPSNANPAWRRQ
jgi:hypothetical protein